MKNMSQEMMMESMISQQEQRERYEECGKIPKGESSSSFLDRVIKEHPTFQENLAREYRDTLNRHGKK